MPDRKLHVPFVLAAALSSACSQPQEQNQKHNQEQIIQSVSTSTPEPTATPEIVVNNLFHESIAPQIYNSIVKRREERTLNDPEYSLRVDPELNKNRISGLILGGRKEDNLTDTILVLSYHLPSHSLHKISIPRDLLSPEVLARTRSLANSRINTARTVGGTDFTKKIIENATGLSMDLTAHIRFDIPVDLIDKTVGYVEVNIIRDINDPQYPALVGSGFDPFFIEAGRHQLDGATALKVARSRHSSSDYVRSDYQRQIIKAYVQRLIEQTSDPASTIRLLTSIFSTLKEKEDAKTLETDFGLDLLRIEQLRDILLSIPSYLVKQPFKLFEEPHFFEMGLSRNNFVVSAGIQDVSIDQIKNGDPRSADPRRDYWAPVRQATYQFLNQ